MESILLSQDAFHIKLDATHSHLKMRLTEIKFDKRQTIGSMKGQLERRFGTPAENQSLELRTAGGEFIGQMADDAATLESYGAV